MTLSPQKQTILAILRDMQWHCSSEFGYIKDDRKRLSELNAGYMAEKGYEIVGKPCDGRCRKNHSSGLFMRKAQKLHKHDEEAARETPCKGQELTQEEWFDSLPVKTV